MNLQDLKKIIEKEVEAVMRNPLTEPEIQKQPNTVQPKRQDISDDELDNFIFYGQSQKRDDENEKTKTKSHL